MNNLKFRVWDHSIKRMTYNPAFTQEMIDDARTFSGGVSVDINKTLSGISDNPNIKSTWMQFTGLKDKNDVEIYESDIVRCDCGWTNESSIFIDQVVFEQGMFGVKMKQHGKQQLKLTSLSVEVIGNIYENLELLEKK